jgi:SPP1 gp7 family putative phage head morphogenesis protein
MTVDEQVSAIERDRTSRENALLLFLLALAERARKQVNRAIRVGGFWANALRGTLLGDENLDQPGGVPILSRAMAETHLSGVSRVGRLLGVPVAPRRAIEDLTTVYRPRAYDALESIRGTLEGAIDDGLREAAEADRINADIRAVGEAFNVAGYSAANPYAAQLAATMLVTTAYSAGMNEGYNADEVRNVLTGLRYVAIQDERTTTICRAYDGVKLPPLDPWWDSHWVPAHWNCRSLILPIHGAFQPTENPPWAPMPAPGFGQRPMIAVTTFA